MEGGETGRADDALTGTARGAALRDENVQQPQRAIRVDTHLGVGYEISAHAWRAKWECFA
jgi:hypothetical protein